MSSDEHARKEADSIFHALAHATRRDILARTLREEHSVSHLARQYDMTLTAVQKHVAVLERAGLVDKRTRGRERLVKGAPEMIRRTTEMLHAIATNRS